jgi:hypothetical protein
LIINIDQIERFCYLVIFCIWAMMSKSWNTWDFYCYLFLDLVEAITDVLCAPETTSPTVRPTGSIHFDNIAIVSHRSTVCHYRVNSTLGHPCDKFSLPPPPPSGGRRIGPRRKFWVILVEVFLIFWFWVILVEVFFIFLFLPSSCHWYIELDHKFELLLICCMHLEVKNNFDPECTKFWYIIFLAPRMCPSHSVTGKNGMLLQLMLLPCSLLFASLQRTY